MSKQTETHKPLPTADQLQWVNLNPKKVFGLNETESGDKVRSEKKQQESSSESILLDKKIWWPCLLFSEYADFEDFFQDELDQEHSSALKLSGVIQSRFISNMMNKRKVIIARPLGRPIYEFVEIVVTGKDVEDDASSLSLEPYQVTDYDFTLFRKLPTDVHLNQMEPGAFSIKKSTLKKDGRPEEPSADEKHSDCVFDVELYMDYMHALDMAATQRMGGASSPNKSIKPDFRNAGRKEISKLENRDRSFTGRNHENDKIVNKASADDSFGDDGTAKDMKEREDLCNGDSSISSDNWKRLHCGSLKIADDGAATTNMRKSISFCGPSSTTVSTKKLMKDPNHDGVASLPKKLAPSLQDAETVETSSCKNSPDATNESIRGRDSSKRSQMAVSSALVSAPLNKSRNNSTKHQGNTCFDESMESKASKTLSIAYGPSVDSKTTKSKVSRELTCLKSDLGSIWNGEPKGRGKRCPDSTSNQTKTAPTTRAKKLHREAKCLKSNLGSKRNLESGAVDKEAAPTDKRIGSKLSWSPLVSVISPQSSASSQGSDSKLCSTPSSSTHGRRLNMKSYSSSFKSVGKMRVGNDEENPNLNCNDTFSQVLNKMAYIGWNFDEGKGLYMSPRVGYDDIEKNPSGNGKDYFLSKESFEEYLLNHYGWKESQKHEKKTVVKTSADVFSPSRKFSATKTITPCSTRPKRKCLTRPKRNCPIRPKRKCRSICHGNESPKKKKYKFDFPEDEEKTLFYLFKNLIDKLKGFGWKYTRASSNSAETWVYITPSGKSDKEGGVCGKDFFYKEDDLIEYCVKNKFYERIVLGEGK